MRACVDWLVQRCRRAGASDVAIHETAGNPILVARWGDAVPASRPSVLFYGHYDVQSPEPAEQWHSPPFEPQVRDGRLYARGASDNKAQVLINLAAIETLLAHSSQLPCNVTLLIEGDEERTAAMLSRFTLEHTGELRCDVAVISDGWLFDSGTPAIVTTLRGMAALEITVRTATGDLHSGLHGGAAPNAAHVLAGMIASLHDPVTGRVAVPGFYDGVGEPDREQRRRWRELPFDEEEYRQRAGLSYLDGERAFSVLERRWVRPTLDVNGLRSGFTAPGVKTLIPAEANAKLSCRLVGEQRPDEVLDRIVEHLRAATPAGAELTIDSRLAGCDPVAEAVPESVLEAARQGLGEAFGRSPVTSGGGWSVPAAEIIARNLKTPAVVIGFASEDDNAHAADEHFRLENLTRGALAMARFLQHLGAIDSRPD